MSTLKEKLKKAQDVNKLTVEIDNYEKAAVDSPKFGRYYLDRAEAKKAERAILTGEVS
jgi:hypothetical protein